MPPGPWSLPFLGVAYKLNPKASHLTYTEWNKKYGDVISFTLFGTWRGVVVSSAEAIKDVLIHKQDHFSDRPPSIRGQLIAGNNDLGFGSDSEMWRYKKKQFMRAIKQHGDAQTKLESITLSIGMEMLQNLEDYNSKDIDPSDLFGKIIISNMMALAYGYSDDQSVAQIKELLERGSALLGPSGPAALLDLCPSLRFLFPMLRTTYKDVQKVGEDVQKSFSSFMNKRKEMRHAHDSKLNEKDVIMIGADIVLGGYESTYFFLSNLFGILVNHPHIQDQAYQEIDNAIGKRAPAFEDRQSIPYMEALMMETLRYASITALSIPHYSHCDSEINGFFVQKKKQ